MAKRQRANRITCSHNWGKPGTTGVAYIDLGRFSVVVALTITAGKMLLVALFFMHVRHSTKLTKLVVLGGLLWLGIPISLTMADFATRGWLGA